MTGHPGKAGQVSLHVCAPTHRPHAGYIPRHLVTEVTQWVPTPAREAGCLGASCPHQQKSHRSLPEGQSHAGQGPTSLPRRRLHQGWVEAFHSHVPATAAVCQWGQLVRVGLLCRGPDQGLSHPALSESLRCRASLCRVRHTPSKERSWRQDPRLQSALNGGVTKQNRASEACRSSVSPLGKRWCGVRWLRGSVQCPLPRILRVICLWQSLLKSGHEQACSELTLPSREERNLSPAGHIQTG